MIAGHVGADIGAPRKTSYLAFRLAVGSALSCLRSNSGSSPKAELRQSNVAAWAYECAAFIESARPGVSASVPYGRAYRSFGKGAR